MHFIGSAKNYTGNSKLIPRNYVIAFVHAKKNRCHRWFATGRWKPLMSTTYHKFCQDCQAMSVASQTDHFTVWCKCNKLHGLLEYLWSGQKISATSAPSQASAGSGKKQFPILFVGSQPVSFPVIQVCFHWSSDIVCFPYLSVIYI